MTRKEIEGHCAMFSANFMWGLMSPFAKFVILGGIVTPLVITNLRIAGAMVLFWFTSLFQKQEKMPPKDLLRLFGAALLGVIFNQGCFIFGVGMTSPTDASIITTSMPLWVMILAAFILKEPITAMKIGGIVAGAAGALLLICGNSAAANAPEVSNPNAVWGDLLVLAAQLSYALYIVIYKDFVNKYSLVTIMKWMFTYSFVIALPFSADELIHTQWSALNWPEIGSLIFIVVGATYLTYALVVVGQKNLRPTVAGMYNYIQPIVACIVAITLGMDTFSLQKLFAVLLIFFGVCLVTRSKSRRQMLDERKHHAPAHQIQTATTKG